VPVVPPPRRTALVPLDVEVEDVEEEPPPRVVAPPEEEDPDDEEPEEDDPLELEPLDGGADRTGCCSEYE
jgi:hypothetical protein